MAGVATGIPLSGSAGNRLPPRSRPPGVFTISRKRWRTPAFWF